MGHPSEDMEVKGEGMRLIDADAITKDWSWCSSDIQFTMEDIMIAIENRPTIDAVPVVRCMECRWGREACGNIECHVDLNIPPEYHGYYWYCPNGERKEE